MRQQMKTNKRAVKTKRGLKGVITKIWRSITRDQCHKLIQNVHVRLNGIVKKDGERLVGRRTQGY